MNHRKLWVTHFKTPENFRQDGDVGTRVLLSSIRAALNQLNNLALYTPLHPQVEQNARGVAECKSATENLEQKFAVMNKENAALKLKLLEAERYKRRWNLRLSGLKEQEGENLREKAEQLLLILPQWADQIGDVIDTIHRLGRKEEGRTRQVILQFTRRRHRDKVWKVTKDSAVCKEQGLRFAQDFIKEDRLAREELWPKITKARSQGQVAFYRGHIAVIDGKVIKATSPF
ncbi:hypothetical protein CRENBAI_019994 [Crenichthys baileyi]|uniref:Uncharacterized protein n=1 Tax=Crenichthys baileyi TaxID=28760 RepID=A0AAV9SH56_9TELE